MVIGLSLAMLTLTLNVQGQGEGGARQQLSLSRLNRRFREDVSRAVSIELVNKETRVAGLSLSQEGKQILWSGMGDGVLREERRGDRSFAHEFIWLGQGCETEWSWDPDLGTAGVILRLPRRIRMRKDSASEVQEELRDTVRITTTALSLEYAWTIGRPASHRVTRSANSP